MIKNYSRKYFIEYQTSGSDKDFYLPCDITHYTYKKYYGGKTPDKVLEIIGPSDVHSTSTDSNKSIFKGQGYFQDPYIQLYNGTCWINLIKNSETLVQNSQYLIGDFKRDYNISLLTTSLSEQAKGGNFISSPNNSIIYVEGISQEILEKIQNFSQNDLICLKCSFKAGDLFESLNFLDLDNKLFRHVDEIICFMPYGENQFKIWFYDDFKITGLNKDNFKYLCEINRKFDISELVKKTEELDKLVNEEKTYNLLIKQKLKPYESGSIDSLINILEQKEEDEGLSDAEKHQLKCYETKLELLKEKIKQIKQEPDMISYANEISKIRNLKKTIDIDINNIKMTFKRPATDVEIQEYVSMLNQERLENLELLSNKIFNKPFSECEDNFVFFPYDPAGLSIFNRLWYETAEKTICLFPNVSQRMKLLIDNEMKKVFSYISGIKAEHEYIETKYEPKLKTPEGTLHCLIKQRFIKP